MYVLLFEKTSENVDGQIALYILDEHYTRVKHKSTLHFLSKLCKLRFKVVRMAVNKSKNIVMKLDVPDYHYLYMCDLYMNVAGCIQYSRRYVIFETKTHA